MKLDPIYHFFKQFISVFRKYSATQMKCWLLYLINVVSFFFWQKYPNLPNYPAYNTLEDTKDYLTNFTDRNNYTLHIKVTQIVADAILRLSDSAVIPYSIQNIADMLVNGKNIVKLLNSSHVSSGENFFSLKMSFLSFNASNFNTYRQTIEKIFESTRKLLIHIKLIC